MSGGGDNILMLKCDSYLIKNYSIIQRCAFTHSLYFIAVLFISNILKQLHSANQHLVTFENAHQTSILAMTTTGDQDVSNWSDKF